jgi:two-component system response regulator FixJ
MSKQQTVCIIDDDEAIRESLRLLLFAEGLSSAPYKSAEHYLADDNAPEFDCMLLDIRMPGMDGLQLFQKINRKHLPFPVIFITGHGDIPLAVSAIKQGAFDFLTKPFEEGELIAKVRRAIEFNEVEFEQRHRLRKIQQCIDACTPREQDVMKLMVSGLPNRGIAESLEISPRTVEIHRAHVMEKMEAGSLPALVRMLALLELKGKP